MKSELLKNNGLVIFINFEIQLNTIKQSIRSEEGSLKMGHDALIDIFFLFKNENKKIMHNWIALENSRIIRFRFVNHINIFL